MQAGGFVGANTGQSAQQNFVGAVQTPTRRAPGRWAAAITVGADMGAAVWAVAVAMEAVALARLRSRHRRGDHRASVSNSSNNTATQPIPVRTILRLADENLLVAPVQGVNTEIAEHLGVLPALHWESPAQVVMQGRTAILRGVVATEHDRDLAERVVRLEATVDQVQNLIAVAGQSSLPVGPAQAMEHSLPVRNSGAGNSAGSPAKAVAPPVQVESVLPPVPPPADSILPPVPVPPPMDSILPPVPPAAK